MIGIATIAISALVVENHAVWDRTAILLPNVSVNQRGMPAVSSYSSVALDVFSPAKNTARACEAVDWTGNFVILDSWRSSAWAFGRIEWNQFFASALLLPVRHAKAISFMFSIASRKGAKLDETFKDSRTTSRHWYAAALLLPMGFAKPTSAVLFTASRKLAKPVRTAKGKIGLRHDDLQLGRCV